VAVIAVDFDGVIHNPDDREPGYVMGRPFCGAKKALELLSLAGHQIVVHSVRGDPNKHVSRWLDYFQIPYHAVTNVKPDAAAYVDDKAIRFTDWPSTLKALEGL
jgi:hypothetical protein